VELSEEQMSKVATWILFKQPVIFFLFFSFLFSFFFTAGVWMHVTLTNNDLKSSRPLRTIKTTTTTTSS